jgi:hypothetical protein
MSVPKTSACLVTRSLRRKGNFERKEQSAERSYNTYNVDIPDDPTSSAQLEILTAIKPSLATTAIEFSNGNGVADIGTPSKEKLQISIG